MKQVKCWVLMKPDGVPIEACRGKGAEESYGTWIEMTGTLPTPGQWVKGTPAALGCYWRWLLDAPGGARERYWGGHVWCTNAFDDEPCANRYADYYWTGDDKPTEGPPSEPEKTCEVRWDTDRAFWYAYPTPTSSWGGWEHLDAALRIVRELGWRVTNDPREVVLVERSGSWWLDDGNECWPCSGPDGAKEKANKRGWRILREEAAAADPRRTERTYPIGASGGDEKPAKQRPTLGEMFERLKFCRENAAVWGNIPDADKAAREALMMLLSRLVEAIGRDRR